MVDHVPMRFVDFCVVFGGRRDIAIIANVDRVGVLWSLQAGGARGQRDPEVGYQYSLLRKTLRGH